MAVPFLCRPTFGFSASAASASAAASSSNIQNSMVKDLPLDSLATTASSFASVHGILVERRQTDFKDTDPKEERHQSYYECAPISLLPNAFPRSEFERVQKVGPVFNILVEKISQNEKFLQDTLEGVVEADPFTAKLLELYKEIYTGDTPNKWAMQADRLGLHRSDYMLNDGTPKQVELNTIASSFGALSARVAALHSHLTTTTSTNKAVVDFLTQNKRAVLDDESEILSPEDGVPENPALENLALALNLAAQQYQDKCTPASKPIILFVVQPGETNTVDQRLLEFQITQAHGWRVIRQSLTDMAEKSKVDPETGALLLQTDDGEQEVAVVYYRAGYAPKDYFGDKEWDARKTMECSRATKSPCLGYHLAGTKKVQQALARPSILESVLGDSVPADEIQQLRNVFAGLYSLGEDMVPDDYRAVESILLDENESQFVLKPQREGGGYNFYGNQMAEKLKPHVTYSSDSETDSKTITAVNHHVLGEFILMERLFPPEQRAILLRGGQVEGSGMSVSELGCFATILCNGDGSVAHNEYAGFLMRTKFSHVDEGGVAAGYATLSSPYLV